MGTSKLDAIYRSLLLNRFFTKGWGKPDNLRRLFEFRKTVSNRDECFKLIEPDYSVTITKEEVSGDHRLLEGHFLTPLEKFLPGIVPPVAQKAHFQALIPLKWPEADFKPMCLHLAGTGDHYFWRRRQIMAKPLMKESNIGSIILENPFYGLRKPPDQVRSNLHNVSDIFVMGGCLILESMVLFHWCERNNLGPLGVTGLSMGGHMASLAATNWPKPLVLVPCLSWSTASAVFLQGVMAQSINWDLLEDQYLSDGAYREKLSQIVTVVDAAFLAGKKFAQKVSKTVDTPMNADGKEVISNKDSIDVNKTEVGDNKENNNNNLNIDNNTINKSENNVIDKTVEQIQINVALKETDFNNKEKSKTDFEILKVELERLVNEDIISKTLYNKLSSNERFELDSKDVEELNQLSKDILPQIERKVGIDTSKKTTGDTKNDSNDISNSLETKSEPKTKSRNIAEITTDILGGFPYFVKSNSKKMDITKIHWRDRETLQFMRGVMDEFTHLGNFSVPYDTSLIIAVCAKHDAYVPREDVVPLQEIWPGAEVRYVDAGHVSAYLLHRAMFRSCIAEAFQRSKLKWKEGRHIE